MTDSVDYCKTCFHEKSAHYEIQADGGVCSVPECKCDGYVYGETRVTSSTGASKGTKDARYDLIPIPALDLLARLYGFGAKKYAAHNWRLGYDWSKSYAAAQRHMNAFWSGEDIDPETQVPHPINAVFHMFALATYLTEHPEFDDRFETRESRSDAESDNTLGNTEFYIVKAKLRDGRYEICGYFFSKEAAEAEVNNLTLKEDSINSFVEGFVIFEGIFQDG
jgi:hypothetical protein